MPDALFIDPRRGPYPRLLGPDRCWGLPDRDAFMYDQTGPVIAHPPCAPWGALSWRWKQAGGVEGDNEWSAGPFAVQMVRLYGGVLEHPARSQLWKHADLPRPGDPPDAWGGWTLEVDQCRWGHPARKQTWLYIVGAAPENLPPIPEWREPTHVIDTPRAAKDGDYSKGRHLPKSQRHITPLDFAKWLVQITEAVNV